MSGQGGEAPGPQGTSDGGDRGGCPGPATPPFPPLPAAGRTWEARRILPRPGRWLSLFRRGSGQDPSLPRLSPCWAFFRPSPPAQHGLGVSPGGIHTWGAGRGPAGTILVLGRVAAVVPAGQRTLHHRGDVLETLVLLNPSDKSLCDEVSWGGGCGMLTGWGVYVWGGFKGVLTSPSPSPAAKPHHGRVAAQAAGVRGALRGGDGRADAADGLLLPAGLHPDLHRQGGAGTGCGVAGGSVPGRAVCSRSRHGGGARGSWAERRRCRHIPLSAAGGGIGCILTLSTGGGCKSGIDTPWASCLQPAVGGGQGSGVPKTPRERVRCACRGRGLPRLKGPRVPRAGRCEQGPA